MGRINILSEELRNKIAAGEVIERPYSAVKELIENSIDAKATEIEIYIERGGKDLIKIVDNGSGIEKDDMRAALLAHATSKISEPDDIFHIHTLGFRGEALSTIAAIACVEIISSTDGQEAYKVYCNGDYMISPVEPASTTVKGTQVSVTKFFFNTPARFKFMKTDKKEEADITSFVTRYILGNPDIAFRYYIDGKLTLQSYGGGLEEAITQVYGANVLPNCFKISADRNDIKISGYISNQNYFKPNKTYQNVYLNGRNIVNPVIASAITNAYSAYAMKRQYPFYVLNIEINEEEVDVNVHPNKSDVRFVNSSLIYGTIYKVISGVLDGTAKAADFVLDDGLKTSAAEAQPAPCPKPCAEEFISDQKVYDKDFTDVAGIEKYLNASKEQKKEDKDSGFDYSPYENYEAPAPENMNAENLPIYKYYALHDGEEVKDELSVCTGNVGPIDYGIIKKRQLEKKAEQEKIEFRSCKYRGQMFNTYLIYEIEDEVYFIDQHAAHERLIYDGLKEKFANKMLAQQSMMVPYIFSVTPEEQKFVEENLDNLWSMGFGVDQFGLNSYRVNSIPADLPDIDLKQFFDELLSNVNELKKLTLVDILKDKIAQTACKHAIKGGEELTDAERDRLFEMLRGDMGLKCPHGRPICLKLTKYEIEKMFKRKV